MINQILKNISSGWLNILLGAVFTIFITPLALNNLGRDNYGIWLLIFNMVGYLYLADFGITNSISRLYSKYNIMNDEIKMGNLIFLSLFFILIINLFIFSCAIVFYENILEFFNITSASNKIFSFIFIVAIIETIIQMFLRVNIGILQGIHKFNITYRVDSFHIILKLVLVLILINVNYFNIITFTLVYSLSRIFANLLTFIYLKEQLKLIKINFDIDLLKEMFGIGFSSIIISASALMYNNLPTVIYGKLFSIDNIIIYAIPISIMLFISKFVNIIFVFAVPRVSELKTLNDYNSIYNISLYGVNISLFINFILIVFCILFGLDIFKIWLGTEQLKDLELTMMYIILVHLVIYIFISNSQKINNIIFKSSGLHWTATVEMVLSVVILYMFVLIFVDDLQEYVFSIGMVFVGFFKYIFYKLYDSKEVKIYSLSIFKMFGYLVAVSCFYFLVNIFNLSITYKLLLFSIFLLFYIFFFLSQLNDKDKTLLKNKFTKKLYVIKEKIK